MTQPWSTPAADFGGNPPSGYVLRPLTTGEVLDRIFTVFRAHFWLFAGLAAVSGGWGVLMQGLQLLVHHAMLQHSSAYAAKLEVQTAPVLILPFSLLVGAVTYAASIYAIGEIYLGRAVTAGVALRVVRGRWLRYIGILLWHYWSAIWLPLLLTLPGIVLVAVMASKTPAMAAGGGLLIVAGILGGGVYGVIAFLRNALALPASIVEGLGVRASMRRSKDLAGGAKGKLFVVLLVAFALYLVAAMLDIPMGILIARSPIQEHLLAQAGILFVGFVAATLVTPVVVIGYALVYFDQRVRKEGFDLIMLMGEPAVLPEAASSFEPMPPPAYPVVDAETLPETFSSEGDRTI